MNGSKKRKKGFGRVRRSLLSWRSMEAAGTASKVLEELRWPHEDAQAL